jgi:predicted acyltransferase
MSIDALRGLDMFWLFWGANLAQAIGRLFVNPLPTWYARQFEHELWNGFTLHDLIMPLFLFVVGAAMPFSFAKQIGSGRSNTSMYLKMARRTVVLYVLGMVLQGHLLDYDLSKLIAFSNTLQAIGIGYFFCGILLMNVSIRWQVACFPILIIGYWIILTLVPVPGAGHVSLFDPRSNELNIARYIDKWVFGKYNYNQPHYTWILTCMGFSATVLLGVLSGHVLRSNKPASGKIAWLAGMAVSCLALGWIWSYWYPINKHVWSGSMALWAGGWSLSLLVFLYTVIDVLGYRKWAFPLVVIGANAIALYAGTRFLNPASISSALIGNLIPRMGIYGPTVSILGAMLSTWFVLYFLYRKKTFIRI